MNRKEIYRILGFFAFGSLLILTDINLNVNASQLNIMPDWIGYILIFYGLHLIKEENAVLKILTVILGAISLVLWTLKLLAIPFVNPLFSFVQMCLKLYYDFRYFTFLAEWTQTNGSERGAQLITVRNITLASTVFFYVLGQFVPRDTSMAFPAALIGLFMLIIAIYAVWLLFKIRSDFAEQ